MIRKCDHTGCTKAGTCRAPKSRDLRDYWWFCQEHAAEYNKNWNFYADMTPDEIEADWERQTFGAPLKDKDTATKDEADYVKFLNDFIMGRSAFDHVAPKPRPNATISNALKTLNLPPTATMREIGARYRALAKKYHPDTGGTANATEFTKVNNAYQTLKKHFDKK